MVAVVSHSTTTLTDLMWITGTVIMNDEHSNADREEYRPEETHYCDGDISYDSTGVTIDIADEDTVELTGNCKHCNRPLRITLALDVEMLQIIDETTGELLHEY